MPAQNPLSYADNMQNVLIISEDAEMVEMWKSLFEQRRYRVISETNAEDGWQTSHVIAPALIVLDLDLPDDACLSLCQQLRSTTDGALLMLNSNYGRAPTSEYLRAGVDEMITASVSPMALLVKSLTWLARQDWIVPRRHGMEMRMMWSG